MDAKNKYFSFKEATDKVGTWVSTLVEFSGVPVGTRGLVIEASDHENGCTVAIVWDMPRDRPLMDWFSKDDYNRFLIEVEECTWNGPVWDYGFRHTYKYFIRPARGGGYEGCCTWAFTESRKIDVIFREGKFSPAAERMVQIVNSAKTSGGSTC